MKLNKHRLFRQVGRLSYLSVFILILLGGIVRSTGSGMGCPDWPKCFDRLVPPTCACQLPPDAESRLNLKREEKLEKFASLLEKLGMGDKAIEIRKDPRLRLHEPFNPLKAWIEYINRLYGALTGLFVFLLLLLSLNYLRSKPTVFWLTLAGFVLTFFNAWLGSKVVVTNLLPGLVSMHFMLSFGAVIFFMAAVMWQQEPQVRFTPKPSFNLWAGLAFISLIQISLGALVRERVDMLEHYGSLTQENGWLNMDAMGRLFLLHRGMSMLILGIHAIIWWRTFKTTSRDARYFQLQNIMMLLFLVQISTGAINTMYPFPMVARILHILLGSICFGIQLYLSLSSLRQTKKIQNGLPA
ncbi:MAG: COX15/CtaA family protein [Bacteroidetes bacterium]|nr:COX15/CtaA family protein [Bacteroidota bacterium]